MMIVHVRVSRQLPGWCISPAASLCQVKFRELYIDIFKIFKFAVTIIVPAPSINADINSAQFQFKLGFRKQLIEECISAFQVLDMQGNETILVQLIIWFSHIFPFFITLNCCHGNQLFSNTIRITDNIIPSFCTVVCFIIWLNFILILLLSFYHFYILSIFYILY